MRRRKGGEAEMWRFRACPKCGGDLFADCDLNGWYEECLQCGYLRDLGTMFEAKEEKTKKPAKTEKSGRVPELALAGHNTKAIHNK